MRKILLALALAIALLAGSSPGMAGASEVTTVGTATAGTATAGTASAGTAAASAPRRPVVHDALGWTPGPDPPVVPRRPGQPGPAQGDRRQLRLGEPALARLGARLSPRHRADRLGAARARRQRHQPAGPGHGHAVRRRHDDGRRYFSRLAFSFTWRGHKYAGTDKFADPCGSTTGCRVTPGTPVA